jgi:DNA-binding NtrC family response regulator
MRVLVLSPDHHFRSVMSLLLARRNCSVTTTANASRIPEIALRESPDVAVIDATGPALATALAMVAAMAPAVGVVLVGDPAEAGRDAPSVLARWGPFEHLRAAIEQADAQRRDNRGD